jgi:probable F420-dependent oxidoreductase
MKIRIGVGVSGGAELPGDLVAACEAIAAGHLDSLWLSDVLTGAGTDPLAGLAYAAGRFPSLKLGTTMLLPGRHPLRLAKALASLDRLSGGRLLVTFVPGLTTEPERSAIGCDPDRRGTVIDEVVPLLRDLWSGATVQWSGDGVHLDDVRLTPLPVQDPLEVWLGGMAPAALRRCGRLADGWLPAMCSPATASAGREVIEKAASEAGRQISDEHFGVSIGYAHRPLDERTRTALARRARGEDIDDMVPVGSDGVRRLVEDFVRAGFSKFVLRPLHAPRDWAEEIALLATTVGDLQT